MTAAELIKRAREAKAWTQRQLADAIGVTAGFVAKVEGDDSLPSYDVCVLLTNVLDISLDELWQSVEAARREAERRRLRTRGSVAGAAIRTRGAVRTRADAAPPFERATRGPAEIAQEIASSPELLTAYRHLRTALADPDLRDSVLNSLEAFARMAESRSRVGPASPKKPD